VVAKQAGLERRTAYQCRQRWNDSIRPGLKKGEWTMQEEESIHQMYQAMGPKYVLRSFYPSFCLAIIIHHIYSHFEFYRWMAMAEMMPSRSNNDIKNKWHQMTRKEARLSQTSSEPRKLDTAVMEVDSSFSSDAAATSTSSITIDMTTITRSEAV
jgi:transcription factor MYB, plant